MTVNKRVNRKAQKAQRLIGQAATLAMIGYDDRAQTQANAARALTRAMVATRPNSQQAIALDTQASLLQQILAQ